MEQTRKNFKISSIVILALAGFSLLQIVFEILFGEINSAVIPESAPDNILLITKIFLLSVAALLLIPNVYIGIKGLRIAKNPNSSKGHIVWAIILLVFAVLSLIDPVVNFVKNGGVYENLSSFLSLTVEVLVYFEYIKYGMEIAKAN